MVLTILPFVLFQAASQTSPLDAKLTLEIAHAPLPAVMKKIEEKTGVPITLIGAPQRDWVYVNFKDRPIKKVLDSLASLCDAEWKSVDGKVTFRAPWPSVDKEKAHREATLAKWLSKNSIPPALDDAGMNRIIAESRRLIDTKGGNFDDKADELYNQTPTPRAHVRLLHLIGAKALSEIKLWEERTYSITGKGRTFSLGEVGSKVFSDLHQERGAYSAALASKGLTASNFDGRYWLPSLIYYFGPPDENVWTITIKNQGSILVSELRGLGGTERVYEKVAHDIRIDGTRRELIDEQNNKGFENLTETFELDPEWKNLLSGPTTIRERLAKNDANDVLTDYVHQGLHQLSESQKSDVAAIIPDGASIAVSLFNGTKVRLNDLLIAALGRRGRMTNEDGVCLVRPNDLSSSRVGRVPRKELGAYVREYFQTGDVDLDTAANLAVASEDTEAFLYAMSYASTVIRDDLPYQNNHKVLRLYGLLPSHQRSTVRTKGLEVMFENLSQKQQAIFENLIDGPGTGLSKKVKVPPIDLSTSYESDTATSIKLTIPWIIPPRTPILFRFERQQKLYASKSQSQEFRSVETNVDYLAYAKTYMPQSWSGIDRYQPFHRSYLQIAADFGTAGVFAKSLPAGGPKKNSRWLTMKEMPEDFQSQFEKLLKAYAVHKEKYGSTGDQGRDRVPPL